MPDQNIIQFGLGRTGTTLVYRVLDHIFELNPGYNKCHLNEVQKFINDYDKKFVITTRHPVDSFISFIRVNKYPNDQNPKITKSDINQFIGLRLHEHVRQTEILETIKDRSIILKYEIFIDNIEYIFDSLCNFFDIIIAEDTRSKIKKECGIEESVAIQDKFYSFKDADHKSQIHGLHIMTPKLHECYKLLDDINVVDFLESKFETYINEWECVNV